MDKLKVYIENRQKIVKIPSGLRLVIRRCCNATLVHEAFEGSAEVNITFVDDEQIKGLNIQYRKKDMPTDVLSFPMGENGEFDRNPDSDAYVLGDIVISLEEQSSRLKNMGIHCNGRWVFSQCIQCCIFWDMTTRRGVLMR